MKTNKEIKTTLKGAEITVPKGTAVTKKAATGNLPEGEWFIEDISFINKSTDYPTWHDAYYYGIRVTDNDVE